MYTHGIRTPALFYFCTSHSLPSTSSAAAACIQRQCVRHATCDNRQYADTTHTRHIFVATLKFNGLHGAIKRIFSPCLPTCPAVLLLFFLRARECASHRATQYRRWLAAVCMFVCVCVGGVSATCMQACTIECVLCALRARSCTVCICN